MYQNPAKLRKALKNSIDDIAGKPIFGGKLKNPLKLGDDFNKIGLDLRVPIKPKGMQKQLLQEIKGYAQSQNVEFFYKVY